ncbi:uncharacterized protein BDZ99DRAFT_460765 [Mytilinidion resinicola]|uniref:Uncharacterized protein n=1 Tax=Mytilinidion resinicola TaxID=574789 RepID=A0A6A6Z024_9PEZI|nr:uncharacterized protein BDZ99DRAFT_460765 [Mytilinidion resinicola]KAF2813535.1 hypothetical protein BDZ99DRAFT_460765 [Mytilinidion resinicola]
MDSLLLSPLSLHRHTYLPAPPITQAIKLSSESPRVLTNHPRFPSPQTQPLAACTPTPIRLTRQIPVASRRTTCSRAEGPTGLVEWRCSRRIYGIQTGEWVPHAPVGVVGSLLHACELRDAGGGWERRDAGSRHAAGGAGGGDACMWICECGLRRRGWGDVRR